MALHDISREELQGILTQLEQALYHHQQWHNDLNRTLVCRLPPNRHDLRPAAHKECRFGQWYYNDSPEPLRGHLGYTALGDVHQYMHDQARELLNASRHDKRIVTDQYDRFTNALERMRLEILSLQHELEALLYEHDPLTRALSRTGILPLLRELQALAKRHAQPCCVVMVDLDHFKETNDRYGHLAGDRVLVAVARHLMNGLRPYDKVFRYGGEEFLLCLQHTELAAGLIMVERLREGLAANDIDTGRGTSVRTTASFGVTLLDPDVPAEQIIERADKALYAAKSAGRNCARVWEPTM